MGASPVPSPLIARAPAGSRSGAAADRIDLRQRTEASPLVAEALRATGQPLPPATRTEMEALFGHDFTRVRVHADSAAIASARALRARAYAVGTDIVFGPRRYSPDTPAGRRLLAHELTHVVQQRGSGGTNSLRYIEPGGAEAEARTAAGRVEVGQKVTIATAVARGIQRDPSDEPQTLHSSFDPGTHTYEALLEEAGRIHRWLEQNPSDSPDRTALVAKLAEIVSTANRLGARRGYPPLNFIDVRPFSKTPQQAQAADELRKLSPAGPPSSFLEPPKPKPPPPPAPRPASVDVLPTYALWGPMFLAGLKDGLHGDAKLQAGLQALQAQLDSTQGKAEFGGGMAVGVVPGALVAVADIPYSVFKLLVEAGLMNARPMSEEEISRAVADLVAATRKLAARLPELAGEVASQPRQVGGWAALLVSERIREDLLLEEPPAPTQAAKPADAPPAEAARKYNPFDYSGVTVPDLYKSARDLITRGKAGQKASSVFNKGVAGGMALGYTLMNLAMLVISPEEMAAKAGALGSKGLEAMKATSLWKRLAAITESIPELKAVAGARRAAAEARAGATAVKGAENLGTAATEQAGKPAAKTAKAAEPPPAGTTSPATAKPPAATPPTSASPPASTSPAKPSNRVPSHGELQEEPIRKLHHPNAQMLSEKAAGFDFVEGQQVVSAHTEQKGNLTIVTERIAGGNWIQLKTVTAEDQVVANIDHAMERADNALKGIPKNKLERAAEGPGRKVYERAPEDLKPTRENQFERVQGGHAYRTSYARQPDRITIHLNFETIPASDQARLDQLAAQARQAVLQSPHRSAVPPVSVLVTGK